MTQLLFESFGSHPGSEREWTSGGSLVCSAAAPPEADKVGMGTEAA